MPTFPYPGPGRFWGPRSVYWKSAWHRREQTCPTWGLLGQVPLVGGSEAIRGTENTWTEPSKMSPADGWVEEEGAPPGAARLGHPGHMVGALEGPRCHTLGSETREGYGARPVWLCRCFWTLPGWWWQEDEHLLLLISQLGDGHYAHDVFYCCFSVAKSCSTLCDPTDHSPLWDSPNKNTREGSISSSRGSSRPRDRTCISWYHLCPLLGPSLHEMFPWYLIFLKRSLVFPFSVAVITEEGFPCYSLELCIQMVISFLFSFAFSFSSDYY